MVCDNVSDAHTLAPAGIAFTPEEIAELNRIRRDAQTGEHDLSGILARGELPESLAGGMALRLTALRRLAEGFLNER